ncbi:MAG TPA: hypothetical protein VMB53_03100 [Gaiellaceae bacterium]|nr:hypothetical protein [Gaiellaceae bacterium]
MRPFVEECLREWKRLGVADPIANEMAADLEADIAEAEADGGSAEDVLGNEAFDAPAFARSWAESRGVIPERTPAAPGARPSRIRRWYPVAGIAACLLLALFGLLLLVAKPERHVSMTFAAPAGFVVPPRIERLRPGAPEPRFRFAKPEFRKGVFPGGAVIVPPDNPGPHLDVAGALFLVIGLGGAAGFGYVLFRRGRGTPATA